MAQQLNLLGTGQIVPTSLHQEMQRSYLEYAMSVIVGRALPDVRDGLKPVHRRILYAMYELGLTPDRPFRKCARVVGDVLGKYHPHGDQSVYDALVRLVQDFSTRYPLLDGHGNFGSVDNDPPAAMRYTETRLAPVAFEAMLQEIGDATVDFSDNFDSSQQEPVVLPVQLPILLLNGCTGIAVGMATNMPPHNLGEVVDGLIALINNPEISDHELFKLIPGPDFPTGGEIVETSGIEETYRTGKGLIPVRGIVHVERIYLGKRRRKDCLALVVTELPYQVNKAAWIEKIADLVNQGRIEGISDIRDESDRTGMRVVIELKKDGDPDTVLDLLYKLTALQSNFGAIMLALVDNKPCQLSLRELLSEFLKFREITLTRQYNYELEQTRKRLHLVSGLLTALNNLDAVIEILRHAADGTTAKMRFQSELELSEAQSDSILAMPMRRLTGLERQKLDDEFRELQAKITELTTLLDDRNELMKSLKKELRSLKRKFADTRRTRIVKSQTGEIVADNSPKSDNGHKNRETKPKKPKDTPETVKNETPVVVTSEQSETVTETAKTESKPEPTPKKVQKQPETAPELVLFSLTSPTADSIVKITDQGQIYWDDPAEVAFSAMNHQHNLIYQEPIGENKEIVIVTDNGKAYPLAIEDLPPAINNPIPTILSLLPGSAQRDATKVIGYFFIPEDNKALDLALLSTEGKIKRIPLSELQELTNRGLLLIKLKDSDRLSHLCWTQEDQELLIATNGGRILRFPVNEIQLPLLGRNAQGNPALRLRFGENIVGCVSTSRDNNLILVTETGYGKQLPVSTLRLANRGDIGTQALQFQDKKDHLAGIVIATPGKEITVITSHKHGFQLDLDSIPFWGKDGTGDRVVNLHNGEIIVGVY